MQNLDPIVGHTPTLRALWCRQSELYELSQILLKEHFTQYKFFKHIKKLRSFKREASYRIHWCSMPPAGSTLGLSRGSIHSKDICLFGSLNKKCSLTSTFSFSEKKKSYSSFPVLLLPLYTNSVRTTSDPCIPLFSQGIYV